MINQKLCFDRTVNDYLDREVKDLPAKIIHFPYFTSDGHWETLQSSGADDWIAGFLPGIYWLGSLSGNPEHEKTAHKLTRQITPVHTNNFNVGFRFQYSHLVNFELTGEPVSYLITLRAARRLLNCFHRQSGVFCHKRHKRSYITATDMYMNLPLLYWASLHDPLGLPYLQCIRSSLEQAKTLFFRPDGSVQHLVKIDPKTGEAIAPASPQGLENGCWSRGLAWLYRGLIEASIFFAEKKYRRQARQLLAYHEKNSRGLIPGFDYLVSPRERPYSVDTSAATIIAGGLLVDWLNNQNKKSGRLGKKIVEKLFTTYRRASSEAGLLAGSCYHMPRQQGINSATVWGDYYGLEALYMSEKKQFPPYFSWFTG